MKNALYKSTALSVLALAGIVFFSLAQPAAAQTAPGGPGAGAGGPGSQAIYCQVVVWLAGNNGGGGTDEPYLPLQPASANLSYGTPQAGGDEVYEYTVGVPSTVYGYKLFEFVDILNRYHQPVDYVYANPSVAYGDGHDACVAAEQYGSSLASMFPKCYYNPPACPPQLPPSS